MAVSQTYTRHSVNVPLSDSILLIPQRSKHEPFSFLPYRTGTVAWIVTAHLLPTWTALWGTYGGTCVGPSLGNINAEIQQRGNTLGPGVRRLMLTVCIEFGAFGQDVGVGARTEDRRLTGAVEAAHHIGRPPIEINRSNSNIINSNSKPERRRTASIQDGWNPLPVPVPTEPSLSTVSLPP